MLWATIMMTRAHLARVLCKSVFRPFRPVDMSCALTDVNACYLNKQLSEVVLSMNLGFCFPLTFKFTPKAYKAD